MYSYIAFIIWWYTVPQTKKNDFLIIKFWRSEWLAIRGIRSTIFSSFWRLPLSWKLDIQVSNHHGKIIAIFQGLSVCKNPIQGISRPCSPGISWLLYQKGWESCPHCEWWKGSFNPFRVNFIFTKHDDILAFSVISQHWDGIHGTDLLKSFLMEDKDIVICIFNIMDADDLVMQGARSSAAMVLANLFHNIPVLATEGLNDTYWLGIPRCESAVRCQNNFWCIYQNMTFIQFWFRFLQIYLNTLRPSATAWLPRSQ